MKNLAPNILRQRLLIEGFYKIDADKTVIEDYFKKITEGLNLRMYGEPIIFSPGGEGKDENQGYDAFVPLIDSGISVYVWSKSKFLSLIIYTCKSFNGKKAIEATKEFWNIEEIAAQGF
ncbi:MAG: S-adenosylmethionine decarboxylase [bacterium]